MHIPTYFTILFLFICSTATAQIEDDLIGLYEEDELITIATGSAKEARFAPSVASVITAKDIKLSGAKTLDQALEMVPGLHVS
ncbi:MAG: Plug domain-containing protein, partial [Pseudomonadales bacterium]|nr:Plug domain-containing protein [Pseudomonadales bacterium]